MFFELRTDRKWAAFKKCGLQNRGVSLIGEVKLTKAFMKLPDATAEGEAK